MNRNIKAQVKLLRMKLDLVVRGFYQKHGIDDFAPDLWIKELQVAIAFDEEKQIETVPSGEIARRFLKQNFKKKQDDILERGFFVVYIYIAYTQFYNAANNEDQAIGSLCTANRTFGSTQSVGWITSSLKSDLAKLKDEKTYGEQRRRVYEQWDSGRWKTPPKAAEDIHQEARDDGIPFTVGVQKITKWIRDYRKSKIGVVLAPHP